MSAAMKDTHYTSVAGETFVDAMEETVEDTAQWLADMINSILDVLAPDGRAFGQAKLTQEQKLLIYVKRYRGQPQAWEEWKTERVQRMMKVFQDAGVPEEVALKAHPHDHVHKAAIRYSASMEEAIQKRMGSTRAEPTSPSSQYSSLP